MDPRWRQQVVPLRAKPWLPSASVKRRQHAQHRRGRCKGGMIEKAAQIREPDAHSFKADPARRQAPRIVGQPKRFGAIEAPFDLMVAAGPFGPEGDSIRSHEIGNGHRVCRRSSVRTRTPPRPQRGHGAAGPRFDARHAVAGKSHVARKTNISQAPPNQSNSVERRSSRASPPDPSMARPSSTPIVTRNQQPRAVSICFRVTCHGDGRRGLRLAHDECPSRVSGSVNAFEDRDRVEQFLHDIRDLLAFDLRFGPDNQAMAQDAVGHGLHVLMREIVPAIQKSAGAGAAQQAQRPPRAGASAMSGCLRLASARSTM